MNMIRLIIELLYRTEQHVQLDIVVESPEQLDNITELLNQQVNKVSSFNVLRFKPYNVDPDSNELAVDGSISIENLMYYQVTAIALETDK